MAIQKAIGKIKSQNVMLQPTQVTTNTEKKRTFANVTL